MDYEYDERTGTFKHIPDNDDDSNYYQNDDSDVENDDISTITKVIFSIICMLCNYVAYRIGWGWLFLTIPMTLLLVETLIDKKIRKLVRIKSFIGFISIMITIIIPLPWWSVLIAIVATLILISDKSNRLW